ncbi:aminodeoxychorismate lyase [Ferruginibacter yonginensis]|uniref:Aminodeoxychorismate lyase n=1 Tax=Ferruginibacter yonginensis TaxID=1310416 RepID=A0ABV8QR43_9BACT
MPYINYNGKIFEDDTAIIKANNRGLRYGDGIFETIKLKNNQLILADEHFARLWKGMQALQFEIPKLLRPESLNDQIIQLAKKNKLTNARVRLTIFRGEGGIYDAKNNTPQYIIEAIALPESGDVLNMNGLQLTIFKDAKKSIDAFSNLKTNNYLPYFMGAMFAKKNHCNDALIVNCNEAVCDSTIANIFIIKNNCIYTPSLKQGCVAGVMRKWLISTLKALSYKIEETCVTIEDVLNADEVFLCNSIYNIRWVASVNEKNYSSNTIQSIVLTLINKYPGIYC